MKITRVLSLVLGLVFCLVISKPVMAADFYVKGKVVDINGNALNAQVALYRLNNGNFLQTLWPNNFSATTNGYFARFTRVEQGYYFIIVVPYYEIVSIQGKDAGKVRMDLTGGLLFELNKNNPIIDIKVVMRAR